MDTAAIVEHVDQEDEVYAKIPWWKIVLKRKLRLKSRTPMPKKEGEGAHQEEPDRGFWSSETEFVLSLLGLAVGLGNIWRFPWMVSRNGGGTFLIPYFFMLIFCGLPLFLMELALGQYSGWGPGNIFKLAPIFQGLGWCVLVQSAFGSIYYIVIITWSFYYFFSSMQNHLPWQNCGKPWNSANCYSIYELWQCNSQTVINPNISSNVYGGNSVCVANTTENWQLYGNMSESRKILSTQEFLERKMYNLYDGDTRVPMRDSGYLKWDLTLTLLFSWIICYFSLIKGIKSSGKVVYFTALFPYFAIVLLLIAAAQLEGAMDGVKFLLSVNTTRLAEPQPWVDAAGQIFFSLGLSGGSVMTYASYNRYNNNIIRDCLVVGLGNSFTSILAAFPVFMIMGYVAFELDHSVKDLMESNGGSPLVFVMTPQVFSRIPGSSFWSAVFFFMLITLGLDSQFGGLEVLLTATMDRLPPSHKLPRFIKQRKYWKMLILAIICLILFLLGLTCVSQRGLYMEEILNYFAGWAVIILATINAVIYSWVYGAGKIIDHIQHMTNKKFPITIVYTLMFLWKFFAPLVIIVIMIFNWYYTQPVKYSDYVLPSFAQAIGWMVAVVPLLLVPIGVVYTYIKDVRTQKYTAELWHQRVRRLTRPTEDWMPSYLRTQKQTTGAQTTDISASNAGNSEPPTHNYGGTANISSIEITNIVPRTAPL